MQFPYCYFYIFYKILVSIVIDEKNPWTTDVGVKILKDVLCAALYDESGWTIIDEPMNWELAEKGPGGRVKGWFRTKVVRFLRRFGMLLIKTTRYDEKKRSQGTDWPMFGYSMIGKARLNNIDQLTNRVIDEGVPGDFVETGVWRGGSTILMRAIADMRGATDRLVWCCDSFEGLPPPNDADQELSDMCDFSECGFLAVSQEQVEANFARFGILSERVKFLKGWFKDTLPDAPIKQIALLRMDGDLYESTVDALSNLYDRVSEGGFIIVDDYYSWNGCRTAVDEFRTAHQIDAPLERIDAHSCYWRVTRNATSAAPTPENG